MTSAILVQCSNQLPELSSQLGAQLVRALYRSSFSFFLSTGFLSSISGSSGTTVCIRILNELTKAIRTGGLHVGPKQQEQLCYSKGVVFLPDLYMNGIPRHSCGRLTPQTYWYSEWYHMSNMSTSANILPPNNIHNNCMHTFNRCLNFILNSV